MHNAGSNDILFLIMEEIPEKSIYPQTRKSLLERVQLGDEESWDKFYEIYSPVVRVLGRSYSLTESECDDLVQLVMVKFFKSIRSYVYRDGKVKFRTWFYHLVRSQAVDHIRANARTRNIQLEKLPVSTEELEDDFMNSWRQAVLRDALNDLRLRVDAQTYQAFELYGLQNRPARQVAEVLGLSVSSVYVAKNRCRKILTETVNRLNAVDKELHLEL